MKTFLVKFLKKILEIIFIHYLNFFLFSVQTMFTIVSIYLKMRLLAAKIITAYNTNFYILLNLILLYKVPSFLICREESRYPLSYRDLKGQTDGQTSCYFVLYDDLHH